MKSHLPTIVGALPILPMSIRVGIDDRMHNRIWWSKGRVVVVGLGLGKLTYSICEMVEVPVS